MSVILETVCLALPLRFTLQPQRLHAQLQGGQVPHNHLAIQRAGGDRGHTLALLRRGVLNDSDGSLVTSPQRVCLGLRVLTSLGFVLKQLPSSTDPGGGASRGSSGLVELAVDVVVEGPLSCNSLRATQHTQTATVPLGREEHRLKIVASRNNCSLRQEQQTANGQIIQAH